MGGFGSMSGFGPMGGAQARTSTNNAPMRREMTQTGLMNAPTGTPQQLPPGFNAAPIRSDIEQTATMNNMLAQQSAQPSVNAIPPITPTASNYPGPFERMQAEQAYTQAFRPGPTGQPFNPNPPAPTTGPQGQQLTTVGGQQGYYRQATPDEIRRGRGNIAGIYGATQQPPVQGYDPKTKQVFVPYSAPARSTQSQQFFQPIYLSSYQDYAPQGFQGPFGGSFNPYGGFNPFMGFGGYGGMYGYAEGGDVDEDEDEDEYRAGGGIDELLR